MMKKIFRPHLSRKQYNSKEDDVVTDKIYMVEEEDDVDDRWSRGLPDGIMELIFRRLPMSDHLSCRDVCPGWRAVIDSKRCLPADHQIPWLLRDSRHSFFIDIKSNHSRFVCDRKTFKSDCQRRGRCVGSIEGWLIMMDTCRENLASFFFLDPVSGARVMLPSHCAPNYVSGIEKVVASSVPMTSTRLQNPQQRMCYVSCLHLEEPGRLAFCTPTDTSWTYIEYTPNDQFLRDIEIVDGKLYAAHILTLSRLMVIDIQIDSGGRGVHTWTKEWLVTLHPNVRTMHTGNRYLVKGCDSSKDLFMVLYEGNYLRTTGFQVLKLEYNVTNGPQWVEMVELGDQVLFLAGANIKFVSSHLNSLEKNSIYFAFDCFETCNSGVFSLTNGMFKPLLFPEEHSHGGRKNETVWFTPNPW